MKTRQLTLAALLVAIGTISAHLVSIPVGVAKCYPVQHAINVISATVLGPWSAVAIAFAISLLRNLLGTGSLLAFPGSMVGALLAGLFYRRSKSHLQAAAGEILGTGVIGALLAFVLARLALAKNVVAWFFVLPFSASSICGSIIGYLLLQKLSARIFSLPQSAACEKH